MIRTVTAEKAEISYCLERKAVKNLNLRIKSDGSVYVSIPRHITNEKADEFVKSHIDFILKHRMRIANKQSKDLRQLFLGRKIEREVREGEKAYAQLSGNVLTICLPYSASELSESEREKLIKEATVCWEKKTGKELFPEFLDKAYKRFQGAGYAIPYPKISVKSMSSRWGSCTPARERISLSCALIQKPPSCIEYVICHELAHFVQQNHSAKFYAVLDRIMPEHREMKRLLNNS